MPKIVELPASTFSEHDFETYKSQIDSAGTVNEVASVVASVAEGAGREKIMYAAERRVNLMLRRKVEEIINKFPN